MPLLLVIAFGAGYAVQYAVLNRVSGRDPLPSLVVTFGLSIVIQNLLQEVFSADPRSIATGGFESKSLTLPGGIALGLLPLAHARCHDRRDARAAMAVRPHAAWPRLSRHLR